MASKIQIFNMALSRVGTALISDPDGFGGGTEQLRLFWDLVLDEELRGFQWNFATKRTALALLAATPVGYDYAYSLPTDCLFVRHLLDEDGNRDDTYEWEVESGELLTDMEDARVLYTREITDPNDFSAIFTSMFAARLAAEVCPVIKPQDGKKQMNLWRVYDLLLTKAKYSDAREKRKKQEQTNAFLLARGASALNDNADES